MQRWRCRHAEAEVDGLRVTAERRCRRIYPGVAGVSTPPCAVRRAGAKAWNDGADRSCHGQRLHGETVAGDTGSGLSGRRSKTGPQLL